MDKLIYRLRELSNAVAKRHMDEFTMRIPAEPERDADLVLSTAAAELARLQAEYAELQAENEELRDAMNRAITALCLGDGKESTR